MYSTQSDKSEYYLDSKTSLLSEHFINNLYHDSIVSSVYPVFFTNILSSFLSSRLLLDLFPIHKLSK